MLRLPPFIYREPTSLAEAHAMKAEAGREGAYVAGGTDLYPNMKRRQQEPTVVISLAGIAALGGLRDRDGPGGGGLVLGAGMTLSELTASARVREAAPALVAAASVVSTPLLRHMGTLGGNLCLDTRCNYYDQSYEWRKAIDFCLKKDGAVCWVAPGSPRCWAVSSSDIAPVAVALGAELLLSGPEGERVVPAARFYANDGIGYLTKHPDEILVEVRLPVADGGDRGDGVYHKVRRRGAFDFPVLGVAAWVQWAGDRVADARIVLGGVASRPQEMVEAAALLRGTRLRAEEIAGAADAAYRPAKPLDNTDFALSWRKQMTRVFVTRALADLERRHASEATRSAR